MRQVSILALEKAAQAWCTTENSDKTMDLELTVAFAKILEEIWSKPWLGNATTKELFEELMCRSGNLDYKTVEG